MPEKTPEETYKVIRKACEDAKGRIVSIYSTDILEALAYLEKKDSPKTPKKIES